MKDVYRVGDDLFMALAFVSFVVGVVLRILSFSDVPFGVNYKEVIFLSMLCLLFSIALSLHDANISKRNS
jgi:ABC-type transport system involved in cytochrome c biogenesis permease subunit